MKKPGLKKPGFLLAKDSREFGYIPETAAICHFTFEDSRGALAGTAERLLGIATSDLITFQTPDVLGKLLSATKLPRCENLKIVAFVSIWPCFFITFFRRLSGAGAYKNIFFPLNLDVNLRVF